MSKRPGIPFARGRKVCIFCGGTPTTGEHIWPDWAAPLLPRSATRRTLSLKGHEFSEFRCVAKDYRQQGSLSSLKIERVCNACNSGWMGTYETAVRRMLSTMIRGKPVVLPSDYRRLLTEYLAYKLMVIDWGDNDPLMPQSARDAFFKRRQIPSFTCICLLNCISGRWRLGLRTALAGITNRPTYPGPAKPPNIKSVALGIGNLFVFALLSTEFDIDPDFPADLAVQLWPSSGGGLIWPPERSITSKQGGEIADMLINSTRGRAVRQD